MPTGIYPRPSLRERFDERYEPEPNSGCWLWVGSYGNAGYGQISINKKHKYAHRVGYELYRGKIPDGLNIDHLCRVPCCVNPWHLEAVTQKENVRRGENSKALRLRHAMKTHCKKGHPLSGDNLSVSQKRGRICKQCQRDRKVLSLQMKKVRYFHDSI